MEKQKNRGFKLGVIMVILLVAVTMVLTSCGKASTGDHTGKTNTPAQDLSAPDTLTAEKVGSIDYERIRAADAGVMYTADGKYGLLTFDGKNDTHAKYDYCDSEKGYFIVASEVPEDTSDQVAAMNLYGLVDATGNVIIPEKYASFDILNDRYIKAIEVTGITESKDKAILYTTEKMFSLTPGEEDTLYTGKWCIYDVTTNKVIEGVGGTLATMISASGPYITYYTDGGVKKTVDGTGKEITDKIIDLGYYACAIETTAEGNVYDSNGEKLFSYNPNDYTIDTQNDDGTFTGVKYNDGSRLYFILDKAGNILSGDYSERITVCSKMVLCGEQVLNYKGEQVIEGSYEHLYIDELKQDTWCACGADDTYVFFDESGLVIWQGTDTSGDDISLSQYDFCLYKKSEDYDLFYFSLKDKDFTIKGSDHALPWVAEVTDGDGRYDLYDLRNNNTLIEGYKDYVYADCADGACYVYAEKAEGGFDVFLVK